MTKLGFIFDLDGVLIDTQELHWEAWTLMKEESPVLASLEYKDFKAGFGQSNADFLEKYLNTHTREEKLHFGEKKEALFRELAKGAIQFLPGIESFLKELKAAHVSMIIGTSSPISNMEFYIHYTIIGDYFTQYVSSDHVAKGKPAPDIFLEAAHRIHLRPENCVILEDSIQGLQAARATGSFVVALATTFTHDYLERTADFDLLVEPHQLNLDLIKGAFSPHENLG